MTRLADHHVLPDGAGLHELKSELDQLGFAVARIGDGASIDVHTGADEVLVVVINAPGGAGIQAGGQSFELPPRRSVFEDEPSAVYAPPGTALRLEGKLLAGIFRARAEGLAQVVELAPYAILPEDVASVQRGRGNFERRVRDILPATRPAARLMAGETLSPPGNWSSSPPHKHDRDLRGKEAQLEEIYLYRVDPPRGFGLQLSYASDTSQERAFVVRDLDVVSIPAGYHPVVAGPGYSLYYLWCLAGRGRELLWQPDPVHAWVDGG
jgi:5-deoxy-glucuronate isomerase